MNDTSEPHLLSGFQSVAEALRQRRRPLFRLLVSRKKGMDELVRLAKTAGIPVTQADPGLIGRLSGTGKHQGVVLECGALPLFTLDEILAFQTPGGVDLLVLLTGVEDPRNLGAVARCCSFLGARALMVQEKGSAPFSSAASRASAGAMESLPLAVFRNAPDACQKMSRAGYLVVGAEKGGDPLSPWIPEKDKVAIVLGSEDKGLSGRVRSACGRIVTVEGKGPTGSLNLSVAAGILIHHVKSRIKRDEG